LGALLAHVFAGVGQVLVVKGVYGGGDMMAYYRAGSLLAELVRASPLDASWSLMEVILQKGEVPLPVPITTGPTGAMMAITGFLMVAVNDSLYAGCILLGSLAFFGKLALYRVFRAELPRSTHGGVLIATLYIPSAVFWSSGILKESLAVTGLCLAVYGGYGLANRRRIASGALLLAAGLVLAGVVKPYTLVPFGAAAGLWLYLDGARPAERRRYRRVRVSGLFSGIVIAAGLVFGVGKVFPRFDPANFAEEASHMQSLVSVTHGGSDYQLGAAEQRSASGQIALLPLALATALFRPVIFEAANPQIAATALEMLVVAALWLTALFRTGPLKAVRVIWGSPVLAFCAVYVLGFAVGVGLGSTNLGSLSRYRIPIMPFYVVLLAVLSSRRREGLDDSRATAARFRASAAPVG
jgi:hypothetical protein